MVDEAGHEEEDNVAEVVPDVEVKEPAKKRDEKCCHQKGDISECQIFDNRSIWIPGRDPGDRNPHGKLTNRAREEGVRDYDVGRAARLQAAGRLVERVGRGNPEKEPVRNETHIFDLVGDLVDVGSAVEKTHPEQRGLRAQGYKRENVVIDQATIGRAPFKHVCRRFRNQILLVFDCQNHQCLLLF